MNPLQQTIEFSPPLRASKRAITVTFADRAGDRILSDAAFRTDLASHEYAHGVLGVWANFGRLEEARLHPHRNPSRRARLAGLGERVLVFIFDEPHSVKTAPAAVLVDGLSRMQVGETKYTTARFSICDMLVFPNVRATRTSKAAWVVTTDGASDVAVCADGSPQHMSFSLEIELQLPVPGPTPPRSPRSRPSGRDGKAPGTRAGLVGLRPRQC